MKNIVISATAGVVLFFFSGCASLQESARGFLGTSVKEVEQSRNKSVKLVIPGDYNTVYESVLSELKKEGRYIYRQDKTKHLIAFYMSNENTTVAGVFLNDQGTGKTEIEIASPSSYARNMLAESLSVLVPPPPAPVIQAPEMPAVQEENKPEQINTPDEPKTSN